MALSTEEQEYVEQIQWGEFRPELVIKNRPELLEQIRRHPGLLWKAENGRRRARRYEALDTTSRFSPIETRTRDLKPLAPSRRSAWGRTSARRSPAPAGTTARTPRAAQPIEDCCQRGAVGRDVQMIRAERLLADLNRTAGWPLAAREVAAGMLQPNEIVIDGRDARMVRSKGRAGDRERSQVGCRASRAGWLGATTSDSPISRRPRDSRRRRHDDQGAARLDAAGLRPDRRRAAFRRRSLRSGPS